MTEKLDEQTDRQIAELEEMAAQVYAALAHHRADALRSRIAELCEESRLRGQSEQAAAMADPREDDKHWNPQS